MQHLASDNRAVGVDGGTVGECLDALVSRYPDLNGMVFEKKGKLLRHVEIFINKKSAYPHELSSRVADGDKINIVNIIAGG